MSSEEIAEHIAAFLAKGGKIKQIERGMSATDMVGGRFNKTARDIAKGGGRAITIKRRET